MTDSGELMSFAELNSRKSGSTSAVGGIIIATSVKIRSGFRSGIRETASEYPAIRHTATVTTSVVTEHQTEFHIQWKITPWPSSTRCCQACRYPSNEPNDSGGSSANPALLFDGASTSHNSGTTQNTAKANNIMTRGSRPNISAGLRLGRGISDPPTRLSSPTPLDPPTPLDSLTRLPPSRRNPFGRP